jgi:AhpD family alkylhydroperoxidase
MPHIALPEGLSGITSAFVFRPETAAPLRALAEVLLRGPSSLTSGEREMIATVVSARNDCYFCQTSHRWETRHALIHAQGSCGDVNNTCPRNPQRWQSLRSRCVATPQATGRADPMPQRRR